MTGRCRKHIKWTGLAAALCLAVLLAGCDHSADTDSRGATVSNNEGSAGGGEGGGGAGDIGPGDWDEDEIDPDAPIDEDDCEKFCNPYNVTVRNVCFQQDQTLEEGTQSCLRLCRHGGLLQKAILCFIEFEKEMDCEELLRCLLG